MRETVTFEDIRDYQRHEENFGFMFRNFRFVALHVVGHNVWFCLFQSRRPLSKSDATVMFSIGSLVLYEFAECCELDQSVGPHQCCHA